MFYREQTATIQSDSEQLEDENRRLLQRNNKLQRDIKSKELEFRERYKLKFCILFKLWCYFMQSSLRPLRFHMHLSQTLPPVFPLSYRHQK